MQQLRVTLNQKRDFDWSLWYTLDVTIWSYSDNIRSITYKPTLKEVRAVLDRELDEYFSQYK